MDKYEAIIYWSNDDQYSLPRCLNYPVVWRMARRRLTHWLMQMKQFNSGSTLLQSLAIQL